MKYEELEKLKPYRIVNGSSDGTFIPGEIIWISDGGEVNSVHGGGFIYPEEGDPETWDFEAEEANDWEVISVNGNEFCRKIIVRKMNERKVQICRRKGHGTENPKDDSGISQRTSFKV